VLNPLQAQNPRQPSTAAPSENAWPVLLQGLSPDQVDVLMGHQAHPETCLRTLEQKLQARKPAQRPFSITDPPAGTAVERARQRAIERHTPAATTAAAAGPSHPATRKQRRTDQRGCTRIDQDTRRCGPAGPAAGAGRGCSRFGPGTPVAGIRRRSYADQASASNAGTSRATPAIRQNAGAVQHHPGRTPHQGGAATIRHEQAAPGLSSRSGRPAGPPPRGQSQDAPEADRGYGDTTAEQPATRPSRPSMKLGRKLITA